MTKSNNFYYKKIMQKFHNKIELSADDDANCFSVGLKDNDVIWLLCPRNVLSKVGSIKIKSSPRPDDIVDYRILINVGILFKYITILNIIDTNKYAYGY